MDLNFSIFAKYGTLKVVKVSGYTLYATFDKLRKPSGCIFKRYLLQDRFRSYLNFDN